MSDDDNIVELKIKARSETEEPMLKVVGGLGDKSCDHRSYWDGARFVDVTYRIREGETEVECGRCGTRIDPMFVLKQLASKESGWFRARERYQDEMRRLSERSKTKCDHCGRMTRISGR